jgi:hypothetical protein
MTSRTEYSTQTPKNSTLFSGQYLNNRWTLDIGVLGYIGIVWPKEHSPKVWSVPPVTPYIYIYIVQIVPPHSLSLFIYIYMCVCLTQSNPDIVPLFNCTVVVMNDNTSAPCFIPFCCIAPHKLIPLPNVCPVIFGSTFSRLMTYIYVVPHR